MNAHDFSRNKTGTLARLLDPETASRPEWRADELGAILRHQLAAPLSSDIPTTDAQLTFGELFCQPQPPVELLELAKQLGKNNRQNPDSGLPPEIATVLYFASIVVAQLRCRQQISDLDAQSLARGIQWALAQPWLDKSLRTLFEEAQSHG